MKNAGALFLFTLLEIFISGKLNAQVKGAPAADTLAAKKNHNVNAANRLVQQGTSLAPVTAPSLKKPNVKILPDSLRLPVQRGIKSPGPADQQAGIAATKKVQLVTALKAVVPRSGLGQSLSVLKKSPVNAALELGEAFLYHPLDVPFSINSGRKFNNVLSIRGTINAWGIPVNVDYSTDQASSMASRMGMNNLFKFDYSPAQFNALLGSDMLRYMDLRRNVFGGRTLTGFAQKAVQNKLLNPNSTLNSPKDVLLAKYLDNPGVTAGLLQLNRQQIRDKLLTDINSRQAKLAGNGTAIGGQALLRNLAFSADETEVVFSGMALSLEKLKNDSALNTYFNNPAHIAGLKNLNEKELAARIAAYVPADSVVGKKTVPTGLADSAGHWRAGLSLGYDTVVKNMAHAMFISLRQNNTSAFTEIIRTQSDSLDRKLAKWHLPVLPLDAAAIKSAPESTALYATITPAQADSVAGVITGIRQQLQDQGLDVDKMLQVEQLATQSGGNLSLSELGNRYQDMVPSNGVQALFSRVQTFKLGAFGDQVPGSVQSRDIFISGTHLTYKAGGIPVTVGYGSVNDISSFKDAGFQNSIYNQPRNMTFISGELPGARGGGLKVSVISSYSREFHNSMCAMPSISTNNVAFTLSKALRLGSLGKVDLDVSKTTTLYNNQFQPGGEAILDKKAGLTNSLSNDLFSAMSFGFRHQLNIRELDAADNLYFNYAGTGYQNPANNGFGGGRMKFGGNIKKSFYNKKLTMIFRTDMSNMPISYTTNDKWKTYQFQLDSRYQVSRKFYIGFKYITNGTDKKIDNVVSPVYGFNKIQVDGNASYKIGKYYSVSHFAIGKQDFTNTNALRGAGNLFMVNYTQTVLLKKNSLSVAVFYNKELSAYQLIGNMLNTDMSYQYMLFGKLRLSSGFTYLDNTGVVRQSGFRQGIQFFSGGHFDLDTYIDLRRNMARSQYPDLYPLCRAELSLKYHFKI